MRKHRLWILILAMTLWGLFLTGTAYAGSPAPQQVDDATCLACHSNSSLTYKFPSGEQWILYVDEEAHANSVHGKQGLACVVCHKDYTAYPHPALKVESVRDYQLGQYQACTECHGELYQDSLDSVHARQLQAGNKNAPVCTDCHSAHTTTNPHEPRTVIALACSKCHSGISDEYFNSAHGAALTANDNPDVPTCVDCHGVHNQEDPRTAAFRLNSPNLCAKCHADEAMMGKYGLSTKVFDTYLADFHGTTVTLFERMSPEVPTNKPVCYDCHGIHNMQSAQDPDSGIFRENLLANCQRCHPDATANFPTSWLSHYEPSISKYPLVYFVKLFYTILIPAVLGFMLLYVALDAYGRLSRRLRRKSSEESV